MTAPNPAAHDGLRMMTASSYFAGIDEQTPFDVAVVTPTIGRPSLAKALESVFEQDLDGRVQVLIGFDRVEPLPSFLVPVLRDRPANFSALFLHLPYSTSERRGGLHSPSDGGALRTILSFTANSRYVAYLDDDNFWAPQHLRLTLEAIQGKAYAYAPRMLIDADTGKAIGEDIWDSLGPYKGRLAAEGGFVDPNCLMIDKLAVGSILGRWAQTAPGSPQDCADRWFFAGIRDLPHAASARPTVNYRVRRDNVLRHMALNGVPPPST